MPGVSWVVEKVAVPEELRVALPMGVVPSRKVIAPVGVPVAAVAVAVSVTVEVTTAGLGAALRVSCADCLTTWTSAGETLAALSGSPV